MTRRNSPTCNLVLVSLACCFALCWASSALAQKLPDERSLVQEFRTQVRASNPLLHLMLSTISPNTWIDAGGRGQVYCLNGGLMVVTQTKEVHSQIEDLLAVLRQARGGAGEGDPLAPPAAGNGAPLDIKSASVSAARRRLDAEFRTSTSLSFTDAALADIATAIGERHGISVVVDTQEGVSLQDALWLLLQDLGLNYVVRDDAVHITTPAETESLIARVYKIGDLLQ
jgi:hypothetical protein